MYVRYEVRLHPKLSRPIADAFVCIQTGPDGCAPNAVPWTKDPAIADERRWRFCIEGDNDTEPQSTIRGKGTAYARLHNDVEWRRWWMEQHGPLPGVLWVVPDDARMKIIREQFAAGWPKGEFLVATDRQLRENLWEYINRGQLKPASLSFVTPQARPALPPQRPPTPSRTSAAPAAQAAPVSAQAATSTRATPPPATARVTAAEPRTHAPRQTVVQGPSLARGETATRSPSVSPRTPPIIDVTPAWATPSAPPKPSRWEGVIEWLISLGHQLELLFFIMLFIVPVAGLGYVVWTEAIAPAFPAIKAALQRTPAPTQLVQRPHPDTPVTINGATVCGRLRATTRLNLRVEPRKNAERFRTAEKGEVVYVLCDTTVPKADGYAWQHVIGERDVRPTWAVGNYLEGVP